MGDKLSARWGQAVIVENKAGAGAPLRAFFFRQIKS
jgi:hypothetical protein